MGELVDQLGNKQQGQLISKEDWNLLVATLEKVRDTLTSRVDDLNAQMQAGFDNVREQLDMLDRRVEAVETTVDVLRRQYRVTLSTSELNYALGEVAEITAQVTGFEGRPLDMGSLPGRPWVDFITAWGQFTAADGFASRGGAGGRTISVQVNDTGIAQVRLRAEHAEGLSEDEDQEISAVLQTKIDVSNGAGQMISKRVAQVFLEAETPREVQTKSQAYQLMTKEYQRADSRTFANYLDAYYLHRPERVIGIFPGARTRWRDYVATLMAIAKDDSDPRTADEGRGYSSIQVTFRDWIDSWIHLDYFDDISSLVADLRGQLQAEIVDHFSDSIQGLQSRIQGIVANQGVLGKLRGLQATQQALGSMTMQVKPGFYDDLVNYAQNAVKFEQTMVYSQANTVGGAVEDNPGLAMFTTAAVQNNKSAGNLQAGIDKVGQAVSNAQALAEAIVTGAEQRVGASVSALESKVDSRLAQLDTQFAQQATAIGEHTASLALLDSRTEAAQQKASQVDAKVTTVSDQVQMLESFDVIDVQNKLADLRVVQTNLQQAQQNIVALQQAVGGG
jgi:archaellum component FlaC